MSRKDPVSQNRAHACLLVLKLPSSSPLPSFLGNDRLAGLYRQRLTYICGWVPPDTPMPFWTICQWATKQKCPPKHLAPITLRQPCYTKVQCSQGKGGRNHFNGLLCEQWWGQHSCVCGVLVGTNSIGIFCTIAKCSPLLPAFFSTIPSVLPSLMESKFPFRSITPGINSMRFCE